MSNNSWIQDFLLSKRSYHHSIHSSKLLQHCICAWKVFYLNHEDSTLQLLSMDLILRYSFGIGKVSQIKWRGTVWAVDQPLMMYPPLRQVKWKAWGLVRRLEEREALAKFDTSCVLFRMLTCWCHAWRLIHARYLII